MSRAISLRQPWAWCLLHGKDVENRDWWMPQFKGWLLIHAGKTFD